MNASADRIFYPLLAAVFFILSVLAFTLDGTNGGGDSVYHYLMAHFAWKHPYLFFDHWGKPLFTMLSAPFAVMGMSYMKLFNVLMSCLACLFTYRIASKISGVSPVWVLPLYFSAPEGMNVLLSGLTEPLFACVFSAALLLYLNKRDIPATILVSFLPLSRSEGLIILVVVTVYLLFRQRFRVLPWLITGQLCITLLGYVYYHDIFWVFTEIPYATLKTVYWKGPLNHFVKHLPYVYGPVSSGLIGIGLGGFVYFTVRAVLSKSFGDAFYFRFFLVYGTFLAFLVSHSLFFYLGIFGEMGLTRVVIAVFPVMTLIALEGLSLMHTGLLKLNTPPVWVKRLSLFLASAMVFYCYGNTHFAVDYQKNFVLNPDQRIIAHEIVPYVNQKHAGKELYYSNMLFPYFFDIDLFEKGQWSQLIATRKPSLALKNNEVIIWDSWFSRIEEKITKDTLLSLPYLKCDTTFSYITHTGDTMEYKIFSSR